MAPDGTEMVTQNFDDGSRNIATISPNGIVDYIFTDRTGYQLANTHEADGTTHTTEIDPDGHVVFDTYRDWQGFDHITFYKCDGSVDASKTTAGPVLNVGFDPSGQGGSNGGGDNGAGSNSNNDNGDGANGPNEN
jgi:hypothetical protein